jgi:hypothetical protein
MKTIQYFFTQVLIKDVINKVFNLKKEEKCSKSLEKAFRL